MPLTAATKTDLYRFFTIAFNAAPGVTYMNQLAAASESGMTVKQIVEVFTTKPEFTASYPTFFTNTQFATKLVNTVVGSSATDAAKAEAVADIEAALSAGLSKGTVIFNVFSNLAKLTGDAKWGGTATLMANKVAYAQYYTEELLKGGEASPSLSALQAVIANVTTNSATDAASIEAVLNPPAVPVSQTFTLTTAADTGAAFTGGAAGDQFVSTATTLTVGDSIDGGAGTDALTLTAVLSGDVTFAGFTARNLETLQVNFSDGAAAASETLTVNVANVASLTRAQVSGTTAVSGNDDTVAFTNVAKGATLVVANATNLNVNATYVSSATSGSADTVAIELNNVSSSVTTDGEITIGAGFETASVTTTGSNATIGDLDFGGTKLVVSGDVNLRIRDSLEDSVVSVDAGAMTGGLTVVLGAAVAPTVTGGAGNDSLTVTSTTGKLTLNAGAGNDTVVMTNNLDADDTVSGGAGTDTLSVDADEVDTTAITTALTNVTGFETLNIAVNKASAVIKTADISADINRVNISAVTNTAMTLNVGAGAQTVGLNVAAAVTAGTALTVDAAGTGTSDSLTVTNMLTAGQMASGTSNITVTDFESVTINTGTYTTAAVQAFQLLNVGATNSLAITGGNGATATTVTAKVLDVSGLTAAATGSTFVMIGFSGDSIVGSAGNDTLVGDTSANISGGAGRDSITGGSGADTISGGDGNDTIVGGGGNDVITGGAGNDQINVSAAAGNSNISGDAGNDRIILNGQLSQLDTVDGGDGTDTLVVGSGDVTAVNGLTFGQGSTLNANISNIERIEFGGLLTSGISTNIVDMSRFDSLSDIIVTADGDAATQIAGMVENSTVEIAGDIAATDNNENLTLVYASTTGTNTLNLRINHSGSEDFGVITAAGIELVNINSTTTNATPSGVTNELDLTIAAATTVTITGDAKLDLNGASINAATINASANTAGVLVLGGSAAQTITGTAAGDNLAGGGGADTVNGGAGLDTIDGGTGNDVLNGEAGNDSVDGGAGNDVIDGGAGADTLNGGDGNDAITGGEGADSITGGLNVDTITLTETTAARDTVVIADGDTSATDFDVINGFDTGATATDDVIDFGSAIMGAVPAANGEAVSAAGRFTYDGDPGTLAAVVTLLQTLLRADAGVDTGTFFFEFEGDTYVGEVRGADGAEAVGDLVKLVGVTGMTTLTSVGTAVTVSGS